MNIYKTLVYISLSNFISAISIRSPIQSSFRSSRSLSRYVFPIDKNSISNFDIENIDNSKDIISKCDIENYINNDYLTHVNIDLKQKVAENIIKSITSSLLPMDSLAPTILKFNEYLIKTILNTDFLSLAEKKILILNSIRFAINGDLLGSKILELYYDIVNQIL